MSLNPARRNQASKALLAKSVVPLEHLMWLNPFSGLKKSCAAVCGKRRNYCAILTVHRRVRRRATCTRSVLCCTRSLDGKAHGVILIWAGKVQPTRLTSVSPNIWSHNFLFFPDIVARVMSPEEYGIFRPSLRGIDAPEYVIQLLHSCWEEDPEDRPDIRLVRVKLKPMQAGL